MKTFDYHQPRSLEEAFSFMEKMPSHKLMAGGTDLMVRIKNKEVRSPGLISLRGIEELRKITKDDQGCQLGAFLTIRQILHHPSLGSDYPLLARAAHALGSVQIRNLATLGGNLCNCSPCADTATALLALDAKVRLQTNQAVREIPLLEFFKGPGQSCLTPKEILTQVLLSPPVPEAKMFFSKKGRVKMDLAIASCSVWIRIESGVCQEVRIAAGSVAPVPLRLLPVEKELMGNPLNDEWITKAGKLAAECINPISDLRASADYRRQLIKVFLQRSLLSAREERQP